MLPPGSAPLTAHAPPQTNEAFILDALVLWNDRGRLGAIVL